MREVKFPISKSQSYLMKTIIGDNRNAIENYEKWIDSVNLTNNIDGESYALIPALYKRLSGLGFDDVNINRYKGIYRKAFYKNSLLLNVISIIGKELNSRNIPVTVIKGIPLLMNYLGDTGIRSMGDADMAVDKENIPEAIEILEKYSFKSDCNYDIYENIDTRHSYSFRNDNNLEIDLHWFPDSAASKNIKLYTMKEFEYKGVMLHMLTPEDFIFQVCLHGASWDPVVSIRWIFDLHTILKKEQEIDWGKLLAKLDGSRHAYIFYVQFVCFNGLSSQNIPEWVLTRLFDNGNNRICRKHAKNKIIRPKTIIGRIGWYGYSYHYRDKRFISKVLAYPRHRLMMSRYDRYRDLLAAYIRKYVLKRKSKKH